MVTTRDMGSKSDGFKKAFSDYLTDFGTTVTLKKVSETKDSMNRVISTSTTTLTIKADIQWVTKSALDHLNIGNAMVGDGLMFVKHNVDIDIEDEITFDNVQWRIMDQVEGEQVQGNVIYKCYLIRKNVQS